MVQNDDKNVPDDHLDPSESQNKGQDAGSALRTVYQRTVDEDIPDEMLDLLSKLT